MNRKAFFDKIASMPPLIHSMPDAPFDINQSQVVKWLIADPEIKQWLFNKAKETERIRFDPATKLWSGIGVVASDIKSCRHSGTIELD